MKTTLKVHNFVLTPSGRPGIVTEVHTKGKTAKVELIGYYHIRTEFKIRDTYPVKKLTEISQKHAWTVAPKFPDYDC
jgi:hypothetical protein